MQITQRSEHTHTHQPTILALPVIKARVHISGHLFAECSFFLYSKPVRGLSLLQMGQWPLEVLAFGNGT
jgi:hypothetical protein